MKDTTMTVRTMPVKGQTLRREAPGTIVAGADAGSDKPIVCKISDESLDRYKTTLALDGWDLERYLQNPVVLWAHDSWSGLPIARAQNTRVEKDGLYSEPVFAPTDLARSVEQLVRERFINATSVSWITQEWSYDEKNDVVRYLKQELLEWSFVPIPGNANALIAERAAAKDMAPLREWAERAMRFADPDKAKLLDQLARGGEAPTLYSFALETPAGTRRVTSPTHEGLILAARAMELVPAQRDAEADEPAMKPCPSCAAEMVPDANYCSACGTKMNAEPAPAADDTKTENTDEGRTFDLAAIAEAARAATEAAARG